MYLYHLPRVYWKKYNLTLSNLQLGTYVQPNFQFWLRPPSTKNTTFNQTFHQFAQLGSQNIYIGK